MEEGKEGFSGFLLTRRDFLKLSAVVGAVLSLKLFGKSLIKSVGAGEENPADMRLIWLEGSACSGCSLSVLNGSLNLLHTLQRLVNANRSVSSTEQDLEFIFDALNFHQTLGLKTGGRSPSMSDDYLFFSLMGRLQKTYEDWVEDDLSPFILFVEGSIPTGFDGNYCIIGEDPPNTPKTFQDLVLKFAEEAAYIFAIGTCSSFGGVPSGNPNPTLAKSLGEFLEENGVKRLIVNIPGCPPHPDWFFLTLTTVLDLHYHYYNDILSPSRGDLRYTIRNTNSALRDFLDEDNRPKFIYEKPIHENCPLRSSYDQGNFATSFGEEELKCSWKLGCKGQVAYADCSLRKWNNRVNMCPQAGAPCINCVGKGFPDLFGPFFEEIEKESPIRGLKAVTAGKVVGAATATGIAAHAIRRKMLKERGKKVIEEEEEEFSET